MTARTQKLGSPRFLASPKKSTHPDQEKEKPLAHHKDIARSHQTRFYSVRLKIAMSGNSLLLYIEEKNDIYRTG